MIYLCVRGKKQEREKWRITVCLYVQKPEESISCLLWLPVYSSEVGSLSELTAHLFPSYWSPVNHGSWDCSMYTTQLSHAFRDVNSAPQDCTSVLNGYTIILTSGSGFFNYIWPLSHVLHFGVLADSLALSFLV